MPKPKLPPKLAKVLHAAKHPTHATREQVRDQLGPVLALVASSQMQIAAHRGELFATDVEHPEVAGHTERLHQTLKAWEKDVQGLMEHARRVLLSSEQYHRYATEIEAEYEA